MRQRKLRNLDERLEAVSQYMAKEPEKNKGHWENVFGNDKPLYIEFGCGKGKFVTTLAAQYPERNFIAIEGHASVLLRAMEKTKEIDLPNLRFVNGYIKDIKELFEENELTGIYLNFSDPWPKAGYAKRRLTHRNYLEGYGHILKPEGNIEFKTDNVGLFEFSLEEINAIGMTILEESWDLHSSEFTSRLVTTEYEEKFKSEGKNIHYVKARF